MASLRDAQMRAAVSVESGRTMPPIPADLMIREFPE